jgi:hypothetical protein
MALPRRSAPRNAVLAFLMFPLLLTFTSCDDADQAGLLGPTGPRDDLVDATNTGEPGFYWVPPVVTAVNTEGQSLLDHLTPEVVICEAEDGNCTEVLRFGPDEVNQVGGHFQVLWDTKGEDYAVSTNSDQTIYRAEVYLGELILGYADFLFGANGSVANSLTSDEYIGLNDGRTLPLNFFIGNDFAEDRCSQDNAQYNAGNDCWVDVAHPGQDNLFVTRDGDAALYIPESALPPDGGPYLVTIRELTGEACVFDFPADLGVSDYLPEFPSCYEYTLDPDPVMLDLLTIGQCIDEDAVADYEGVADHHDPAVEARIEELQLGADHGENPTLPEGVERYELMPNVPAPATLSCDDYVPGPNPSGLAAAMQTVRKEVSEFFLGEVAHAGHSGLGGSVRDKSIVQWVDPGVRIAGFSTERGGFISPLSGSLSAAMQALVHEYGYVWRTTADTLDGDTESTPSNVSEASPLFNIDVDLTLLGTVETNTSAITALDSDEQDALGTFVEFGGCALLMPDNSTFGGGNTDAVNESLIDPFGLDITGTLSGQQVATVNAAGAADPATAGIQSYLQNYPGWFDGTGNGTTLATNSGGPALVAIAGGMGQYGTSGPVYAFSDANQFFGSGFSGKFGNATNQQLFLQSVAACGTEPASPYEPPIIK